jgi:acyl-CoA reductase-like NAD-dependent aldehyde dehydrogenase
VRVYDKLYIGGQWVPSTGSGTIDVVNPSTEELAGSIPEGTPDDVDRAVAAAKAAFETWSQTSTADRAKVIQAIAEGLASRTDEIADAVSSEMGMPIMFASMIQAGLPTSAFTAMVEILEGFAFEEQVGNSLVVKEPVGIAGAITPWNYPLHQIAAKVAPALAAGCTIVLKPSEVAPLNAFILAEIVDAAGVPAGVFNLVSGTGPVVGEAIASHPDVDMVSFTGSTRAGRRVSELAAQTVKRVHLELGGKSANIILDDADLDACIAPGVVFGCYLNSGQTCSALTRMLVPRDQHDQIVERVKAAAESVTVGPGSSDAQIGPLVSATQRERVRGYIQKGIDEGARLVTGGLEPPEGLDTGYFVRPTVFAEVTPDMTIAQEEIFGPVLVVMPYDDEDDAVRIAHSTVYGLSGAVQSRDIERATRVARRLRTGQVEVSGGRYNLLAPFGGYRQSGNGREHGRFGLEEYLETKSMQLPQ